MWTRPFPCVAEAGTCQIMTIPYDQRRKVKTNVFAISQICVFFVSPITSYHRVHLVRGGLNGVGDDRAASFELFKCARRPLAPYWGYPVSSIEAVCERGVYALNIWEISKNGELFLVSKFGLRCFLVRKEMLVFQSY